MEVDMEVVAAVATTTAVAAASLDVKEEVEVAAAVRLRVGECAERRAANETVGDCDLVRIFFSFFALTFNPVDATGDPGHGGEQSRIISSRVLPLSVRRRVEARAARTTAVSRLLLNEDLSKLILSCDEGRFRGDNL